MRDCIVCLLVSIGSLSVADHSIQRAPSEKIGLGAPKANALREIAFHPSERQVALPKPILSFPLPIPLADKAKARCDLDGKRLWVDSYPQLIVYELPSTKPKVFDLTGLKEKGDVFWKISAVSPSHQYAIRSDASQLDVLNLQTKKLHDRIKLLHQGGYGNFRAFVPEKQQIVYDKQLKLIQKTRELVFWDLTAKKAIKRITYSGGPVSKVSRDLKFFSYKHNNQLVIQSLENGKKIAIPATPTTWIRFGSRFAYLTVNRGKNPNSTLLRVNLDELMEKGKSAKVERIAEGEGHQFTEFSPIEAESSFGTWDQYYLLDQETKAFLKRPKHDDPFLREHRKHSECGPFSLWLDKKNNKVELYHRASLEAYPAAVNALGKNKDKIVKGLASPDPRKFLDSVEAARRFLPNAASLANAELEKLRKQGVIQKALPEYETDSLATLADKIRQGSKGQRTKARDELIRRWRYANNTEKKQIEAIFQHLRPNDSSDTKEMIRMASHLLAATAKSNEQLVRDLGSKAYRDRSSAPGEIQYRLLYADMAISTKLTQLLKQSAASKDSEVSERALKLLIENKKKGRLKGLPVRRLEEATRLLTLPSYLKIRKK